MLLSMTGHGEAIEHFGNATIYVEVRTVNNRFLKVVSKVSNRLAPIETQLESWVRDHVRRGTISLSIRFSGDASENIGKLNEVTLTSYVQQARAIAATLNMPQDFSLGDFLGLPGVVEEAIRSEDDQELHAAVARAVARALTSLNAMRAAEGAAMGRELLRNIEALVEYSAEIHIRAPSVIEEYRGRLTSKVEKALQGLSVNFQPGDILREVQLFADKCDIREELVRLESHCRLFRDACAADESQGRKLDFLVQELNREVNTIGSKANDASITERVVSMKTVVEQLRELVQNVE